MFNFKLSKIMPRFEADGGGAGGTGAAAAGAPGGEGQSNDPTPQSGGQTYSQADLDRIAGQGESRGQAALLKALGFEDEDSAKAFLKEARLMADAQKTGLEKAQEALKKEQSAKTELEGKVTALERNLAVIAAGVPAEKAGDIALLAASKMTDGKSFDDGLAEVKKIYPQLFENASQGAGTGTGTGGTPPRGGTGNVKGEIGKRLAEKAKKHNNLKEDPYFKD